MKYYVALALMLATAVYAADDNKTSSGALKKKDTSIQYQCPWCGCTYMYHMHDTVECRRKQEVKRIEAWIRKQVQG